MPRLLQHLVQKQGQLLFGVGERGQVLDQLGRHKEADEAYRKVISGEWAPGLQGYVKQAQSARNN